MATPTGGNATPVFRIIDSLAPNELHRDVWAACQEKRWYFGNQSVTDKPANPFWKMDLDGVEAIDRLWVLAKAGCEKITGRPLRVARQYANGHTYGLGGQPHRDDVRNGTFTLLYYPMLEWQQEWEGETLFFGSNGMVTAGVPIAPNRAVLFDSRVLHAGRAPGRSFSGLRVTLAFKLEPA